MALQAESTRIHNEMNTMFAKITRLRRQRRQVETKGLDMLRRGLKSMDELEEAERNEAAAEEQARSEGVFRDWTAEAQHAQWEITFPELIADFGFDVPGGSSSEGVVHQ